MSGWNSVFEDISDGFKERMENVGNECPYVVGCLVGVLDNAGSSYKLPYHAIRQNSAGLICVVQEMVNSQRK